MPGIVSMASGNVSEAEKEKQDTAPPLPTVLGTNSSSHPRPRPGSAEPAGEPGQCPQSGSTAHPARGNPAARSGSDGLSLMSLSPVTGETNTAQPATQLCSHFTALHASHLFMGGVSTSPSPAISAVTCAINKRAPRRAPKPGNLGMQTPQYCRTSQSHHT